MNRFSVKVFGCRVNQAEAFEWSELLRHKGWHFTAEAGKSNLLIVNTCTLTHRADRDVRQFLNKMRRENPRAQILITGCLAEREPAFMNDLPESWQVYSNKEKARIIEEISHLPHFFGNNGRPYRSRAFIKIQDGCNYRCTFCIVPYVRGKSRSLPREKIFQQVDDAVKQGFRELVLTGVHVCLFGREKNSSYSLLDLLRDLTERTETARFRLGTIDPRFLNDELVEFLCSSPRICPHFHFSLQSGSDNVLCRMGRGAQVSSYRKILQDFQRKSPQASIGCDILTGFPQETDDEYEETFRFLEDSPLTYFHVFSYSPRPGTKAAEFPQVNEEEKRIRASKLRALGKKKNLEFRRRFTGKELRAVIIQENEGYAEVLTENYIKTKAAGYPTGEKEPVRVKITRVEPKATWGEFVSND